MADFRTRQEQINATIAEIKNEISATNADIAKTDGRISRTEAEIEETEIEIEETEAKLTKAKQRNDDAKVSKHEAELKKLNKSLKHPIEYVAILQKTRRVQLSLRDQLELSMQKTLSARLQTAAGNPNVFKFPPEVETLNNVDDAVVAALITYRNVGAAMASQADVVAIRSQLATMKREIKENESNRIPYVAVIAPSGSGKTQLPFCIVNDEFPCVHISLVPSREESRQPINSALLYSNAFLNALWWDLEHKFVKDETVCSLSTHYEELHGCAAIAYFLGLDDCTPCTVRNLRSRIGKLDVEKCPIFFFDDAQCWAPNRCLVVRYACNLMRALGLLVVLMGTDRYVADLINPSPCNVRIEVGRETHWCTLITKLPNLTAQSVRQWGYQEAMDTLRSYGHDEIVAFVDDLLPKCLPSFIKLFCAAVFKLEDGFHGMSSVRVLECILQEIKNKIFNRKSALTCWEGVQATIALYLKAYRAEHSISWLLTAHRYTSYFVSAHFAHLTDETFKKLYLFGESIVEERKSITTNESFERWKAKGQFPNPSDNPLLYLVFSGFTLRSFVYDRYELNTLSVLLSMINRNNNAAHDVCGYSFRHHNAMDDLNLEALAAIAVAVASQRHGLSGCRVADFLPSLVEELMVIAGSKWTRCTAQWGDGGNHLGRFAESPIPFASLCNENWPTFLTDIPGTFFGLLNVEQCKSAKDIIDFRLSSVAPSVPLLTGECQKYCDCVTLKELKKCMLRLLKLKHKPKVHLVIAKKLQDSYFVHNDEATTTTTTTWNKFSTAHKRLLEYSFMKVVADHVQGRQVIISLQKLFQGSSLPSDPQYQGMVVFIDVKMLSSLKLTSNL